MASRTRRSPSSNRIVEHPGLDPTQIEHVVVHVWLARAHAQAGRIAEARKEYETFFDLWKEADPDIPLLLQAKAEYATDVRSDRQETSMMSAALLLAGLLAAPADCDALARLTLPSTTITTAHWVQAGPFSPPPAQGEGAPATPAAPRPAAAPIVVPAHCRVAIVMRPSNDSHIEAEVWLPAEWNGKFQAVGNGGWAGSISYPAMARALQDGYATASTDTGHKGGNASFAIGHPEKLIDFGYRAVHEMTVQAKALIAAYYKQPARLSYWNGCSTGGRQGLMAAQRYPDDFDAILAGAPANNHSRMACRGWRYRCRRSSIRLPRSRRQGCR